MGPRNRSADKPQRKPKVITKRDRQLAARIVAARLAVDMEQETLARKVGISGGHMSKLERALHSPSAQLLGSIADALGVSSDFLRKGNVAKPVVDRHDSDAPGAA